MRGNLSALLVSEQNMLKIRVEIDDKSSCLKRASTLFGLCCIPVSGIL